MGRTSISGRLDRAEEVAGAGEVRRITRRLAAVTELSEVELIQEAERIAQICQQLRITAVAGMTRYLAEELGIPVHELEQDLARIRDLVA